MFDIFHSVFCHQKGNLPLAFVTFLQYNMGEKKQVKLYVRPFPVELCGLILLLQPDDNGWRSRWRSGMMSCIETWHVMLCVLRYHCKIAGVFGDVHVVAVGPSLLLSLLATLRLLAGTRFLFRHFGSEIT